MLEPELNPIPQSIEKKPSLLRIAIDINQPIFPTTESSQYLAWQEGQLEVGDLHANALKLFYFLNFHQILTVTSEEYTNFKNIYYQKNLTKEDIESFNTSSHVLIFNFMNVAASSILLSWQLYFYDTIRYQPPKF